MSLYLLKHDSTSITKDSVLFNTSDDQIDILIPFDDISRIIIELANIKYKMNDLDIVRLKAKKADLEVSLRLKQAELKIINDLLNGQ